MQSKYKYNVFKFDLTNGLNEEINIQGGFIYLKDATDLATTIDVKPDYKSNDAITLKKQFGIVVDFSRLYITAGAQAGKSIELLVTDSLDTFRIFEQAQLTDIGTVAELTNIKQWGGAALTGRDISADLGQIRKFSDGEQGAQVAKSNQLAGVGTTIIHTVTAGKTLILESAVSTMIGSAAGQTGTLLVRDASDVTQYTLFTAPFSITGMLTHSWKGGLLIPAGYDIVITSNGAGVNIAGFIKGREI